MSLILCGMQNSGKTTVGKILASRLERPFIDTDRLIEKEGGASCRELYLTLGEESFRTLEKKAIHSLDLSEPLIVATGGGSLIDPENRLRLKKGGLCIYLKATSSLLLSRFKTLPAHLESFDHFSELVRKRTPLYEEFAHFTIETDLLTPEQIADKIRSLQD